ncbi:MAG: type II toxin-antitoxin system RelE/ParE family toxin [Phycisphaerae bacterium]
MTNTRAFTFIYTGAFTRQWQQAKLTDADLREVESLLMHDPEAGAAVSGTGGLRKLRIAVAGRGKRGGGRIGYAAFPALNHIAMILLYLKNDQGDIAPADKAIIRRYLEEIETYIRGKML